MKKETLERYMLVAKRLNVTESPFPFRLIDFNCSVTIAPKGSNNLYSIHMFVVTYFPLIHLIHRAQHVYMQLPSEYW